MTDRRTAARADRHDRLHGRRPEDPRGPLRRQGPRDVQQGARRRRATTSSILGMDGFAATYHERRHRGARRQGHRRRPRRTACRSPCPAAAIDRNGAAAAGSPTGRSRSSAATPPSTGNTQARRRRAHQHRAGGGAGRRAAAPLLTAAARDARRGGWTLTLQGKRKKVLPIGQGAGDASPGTASKAGNINPSLRYVYRGQTLYKLVGLVDDGEPGSFNVARAKKGYTDPVHLPRRLQAQACRASGSSARRRGSSPR